MGADILPVAVGHPAEDRCPGLQQLREYIAGPVHRLPGRHLREHLGFHHVNAGVDGVREPLAPGGLLREALVRAVVAAMTIPNSRGFGTRVRATVTSAPFSLCACTRAERSISVSASPEITRNGVSRRASSAFLTLPAVPSGVSSVAYCRLMPTSSPSPK